MSLDLQSDSAPVFGAAVTALALLLTQCGGPGPGGGDPITGVNPDGSPRWANRGSGAYDSPHGKAFYGVGMATGIANKGLLRQTVDNRARAEIAKIFDTYIAAVMKDYQRSTTAGDFSSSAEEQDIVSAQKTITEVTLRGVEIRDHWLDPQGTLFALAVLDLENITRSLDGAGNLNARVRDYVRANARRAFNDLDRELARRPAPRRSPPAAAPPPPAPAPAAAPQPAAPQPAPPAAEKKPGKVRVGLRITGSKASIIQTCFANRLLGAGYELYESTSDVDVMVRGKLSYSKAGRIHGSVMVNATAEVRVSDMESGKTNAAVAETIKVGRPTLNQSLQTAISQLCDRIVPKIVAQIRAGIAR
jgi:hypothetical protein